MLFTGETSTISKVSWDHNESHFFFFDQWANVDPDARHLRRQAVSTHDIDYVE